jgi:hypothetical protein
MEVLSKFIRWRYAVTNIEKGCFACSLNHPVISLSSHAY